MDDAVTSAASILLSEASCPPRRARRRAHLVAVISSWRLATTIQIQKLLDKLMVIYGTVNLLAVLHCIAFALAAFVVNFVDAFVLSSLKLLSPS